MVNIGLIVKVTEFKLKAWSYNLLFQLFIIIFLLITVDLYTISPRLKYCFILVVDGERELKDFMDKSRAVIPYPHC